ncbi:MAG: hypothetical protein IJR33_10970, partial [Clostridia bacterium]|nr:hypothetical protein [Clostridia bacterium]
MKRFMKKTIVMLTAGVMMLETCNTCIAYAADVIAQKIDPTRDIALKVPEKYKDGGNWFFIAESNWTASEKSDETMYIPIQRTGGLDSEADVVLKIADLSAKHDVNYTAEIYRDDAKPETDFVDMSVKELVLGEDVTTEEFEPTDENKLGEIIHETGGAALTDANGSIIGSVTATPLDENGNPIVEEQTDEEENAADAGDAGTADKRPAPSEKSEDAENTAQRDLSPWRGTDKWMQNSFNAAAAEETPAEGETMSPTERLRAARNTYTGTVSDRQELEGGDIKDLAKTAGGNMMSEDEFNKEMADATAEDYPGRKYALHFNAGEEVKFLKVTPKYSEAAEGDALSLLMLKEPSDNYGIGEDTNPVSLNIIDEDEPEPVTISMAAENVTAVDGKAKITVTREGRLNAIK